MLISWERLLLEWLVFELEQWVCVKEVVEQEVELERQDVKPRGEQVFVWKFLLERGFQVFLFQVDCGNLLRLWVVFLGLLGDVL